MAVNATQGARTGALLLLTTLIAGCAPRALPARPPAPPPPLAPDEAAPLRSIRPGVLRGLMTAGGLRVEPDAALNAVLAADGEQPRLAIVTVCLDERGAATGVVSRPSGLPAFDAAALATVATWRFRPYRDGATATATAACGRAAFRHGAPALSDDTDLPLDWYDALPAAELELPPARHVTAAVPAGEQDRRPTPGVALLRVCRRLGSTAAPEVVWLQSSGDPAVDRELYDRRVTVPVGEPAGGPLCMVRSSIVQAERAVAPEVAPTATMGAQAFAAQRIAGDKLILPADDLKRAIQRSAVHGFVVEIVVCIDRAGRPAAIELRSSSGYTGYDADFINGVATWRYTPAVVGGAATPVCGVVRFQYQQR